MILADKLIWLRKKNGLSQEEFAEKIDVSRQAVSRWEGAQTYPDLTKIVLISKLFGILTDYLLIDELDDENKPAADAIVTDRNGSAEDEVSIKAEEDPGYTFLRKKKRTHTYRFLKGTVSVARSLRWRLFYRLYLY